MPVAKVQLEDGRIAKFEVPEGTTQEQVMAYVSANADKFKAPKQQPAPQLSTRESMLDQALGSFKSSILDFIKGSPEAGLSAVSNMVAQPVSGIAGLANAANPLSDTSGADTVKAVQKAMTYKPRSEEGQMAADVGKEAVGGFMESSGVAPVMRGFEKAGDVTLDVTGSPAAATAVKMIPDALMSYFGVRGLPSNVAAREAVAAGREATSSILSKEAKQPTFAERINQVVAKGEAPQFLSDVGFREKLGQMMQENPEIFSKYDSQKISDSIKSPEVQEAAKQGFDEGTAAIFKNASSQDKSAMRKMVDIAELSLKNKRYGSEIRAADVVGDSVLNRYKAVLNKNKEAGKNIEPAARDMQGTQVDVSDAFSNMKSQLENLGVTFSDTGKPILKDSFVPKGAQPLLRDIIEKVSGSNDGYRLHQLKQYIDNNVSYGKANQKGLDAKTENIVKEFRAGINDALNKTSKNYEKWNTQYADTIGALNDFATAAGKSTFDPKSPNAAKFLGTLVRSLTSNNRKRVQLDDSVVNLEAVAKKYGDKFSDDIITQAMFANELETMFDLYAKTSFTGQIVGAGEKVASSISSPISSGIKSGGKFVDEKIRNINEEGALKSLRELLKE